MRIIVAVLSMAQSIYDIQIKSITWKLKIKKDHLLSNAIFTVNKKNEDSSPSHSDVNSREQYTLAKTYPLRIKKLHVR